MVVAFQLVAGLALGSGVLVPVVAVLGVPMTVVLEVEVVSVA
jgi:hypothetical protein